MNGAYRSQSSTGPGQSGRWFRRGNTVVLNPGAPAARPQQEYEAEFPGDIPYTRRVINDSIDVKAQRALISMLNSGNPAMVIAAESIIDWVELKRLRGVYQPDQKVPALAARDRSENWWEMLKGKNARVFCASPASLPILIFRKDIDQATLMAVFVAVVRRDGILGGTCSISNGRFCGNRRCENLFTF